MTLWVVTPVYLDVPSFLILRDRIYDVLGLTGEFADLDVRFVAVDDTAGRDPQIAQLADLDDVAVLKPPFNLGHQRAIVYAIRKLSRLMADEDYVVTMDADGEDAPEDVPRLLHELHSAGSERIVVLAERTSRQESLAFRLFYICFRAMFRLLAGTVVRSGNFAAYRGWVARSILTHPHFDLCYSSTLTSLDLTTVKVPCARATRYAGESRMNFSKLVRHGLSMLMPFLDRIAIRALITFSVIVTACIAMGVAVLAIKFGTHSAIPGWATATLLALVISSLVAIGNFVVLFAVYTQSRGLSLSALEQQDHGSARSSPAEADRTLP